MRIHHAWGENLKLGKELVIEGLEEMQEVRKSLHELIHYEFKNTGHFGLHQKLETLLDELDSAMDFAEEKIVGLEDKLTEYEAKFNEIRELTDY